MVAIVGVAIGSLTAAAAGPNATVAAFRLISGIGFAIGVLGLAALPWAAWSDRLRTTVRIVYVLDPLGQKIEDALQRLFVALEGASAVWSVRSELEHGDAKRHAGATVSVDRHRVSASLGAPPSVRTNVVVGRLEIGSRVLHFFPDRILLYSGSQITAIDYDSLRVSSREVRFVEDAQVPSDASVVGETWRYINKDGSPDRRFAGNHRLPVVLYGVLEVDAGPGLQLALQTSQAPLAGGAAQILRLIAQASRQARRGCSAPPVSLQAVDSTVWDDDPPPLAGFARSLRSGFQIATRGLSLRWAHDLPEWLQPMVWGMALSVPLLTVGLRLLRPAVMPLPLLAVLLVISFVTGVGLLRPPQPG